ncbi:MAG: GTP cyclohydrolase I FolE2, partial [Anaerolineae bacterium]|nr:GTP cyclohydrolase I FolE2 [Anaerolineae bacterium]
RGTLLVGTKEQIEAFDLVHIVEGAMSSEVYELLKRPDEFFVVNKAHRNPRFVEDVVREMLYGALEVYLGLPDDDFVLARQENFESIHRHNAFAEHSGTLRELRAALRGDTMDDSTTLAQWLSGKR